ncbi:MAG: AAA family ATPase, partial [Candidatus Methylacidiphilales bacterium]
MDDDLRTCIISDLLLPDTEELKNYKVKSLDDKDNRLIPGLSKVNFIVGENNSGKSRLIREIASQEELIYLPENYFSTLRAKIEALKNATEYACANITPQQQAFKVRATLFFENATKNTNAIKIKKEKESLEDWVRDFNHEHTGRIESLNHPQTNEPKQAFEAALKELRKWYEMAISNLDTLKNSEWVYIPTLRGLRRLNPDADDKDEFELRTKTDYFSKAKRKLNIFTGLGLYKTVRSLLLGWQEQRTIIREFETFLSREFYSGENVTLIPHEDKDGKKDVLNIQIGDDKELPVYKLGDGLQHVIIITFPLFLEKDTPALVFIEEPELFLHPGMQRTLLKTLIQYFPKKQFFITTHSNHLLDLTIEFNNISIYLAKKLQNLKKEITFLIEPAQTHDRNILDLLGTRASSVFLSNCTIWVEGITDRRYLSYFLERYKDELLSTYKTRKKINPELKSPFIPKQDFHFSFVEYSGGNITHWSFLDNEPDSIEVERISSNIMVIADNDGVDGPGDSKDTKRKKEKKKTRLLELTTKLGERFYGLESREIENLLTPSVIINVLEKNDESPRN